MKKSIYLEEEVIEEIVRRSYQYIAMYNTINNFAMGKNGEPPAPGDATTLGWNKLYVPKEPADHTLQSIPRPNNDTLYLLASLDLRNDAVIIDFPRFDSKYVSLETSSYDHYCKVPLTTRKGDFKERTKILFYSDRTDGYQGEHVDGILRKVKMTGDFAIAFLRVMPHMNDECRFDYNLASMETETITTLSEFQNGTKKPTKDLGPEDFPKYGNDQQVFGTNFLEVMQFVFNSISFDPEIDMDNKILKIMKKLGVEPDKEFNPRMVPEIDSELFATVSKKVFDECLNSWNSGGNENLTKLFRPKGHMQLQAMTMQSAVGPVGLPYEEAQYPGIKTNTKFSIRSDKHYIVKMTADEMPPADAFWSVTLYDSLTGFFIPNGYKKYSVGENAGIILENDGSVEIHICPYHPGNDVPYENWLPSEPETRMRDPKNLDLVMRVYAPNLTRMGDADELVGERWTPPIAQLQKKV